MCPIWVHAMAEYEQCLALTLNPRVIAHVGFMSEDITEDHAQRIADSGVYVNSTMTTACLYQGEFKEEWCETPLALLTVPEVERETALSWRAWRDMYKVMFDLTSDDDVGTIAENLLYLARRLIFSQNEKRSLNALKMMHDKGASIALGSDAGNWPLLVNCFHGWSTIMELGFMAQAGMPLNAIIKSSTLIPAEMMGLADRIGTVEVGKYADLIVLDGDPLTDIGAYQTLKWTIKNGVCKTPEQWMR